MTIDSFYFPETRNVHDDEEYTFLYESIGDSAFQLFSVDSLGVRTPVDSGEFTNEYGYRAPIYSGGVTTFSVLPTGESLSFERSTPITQEIFFDPDRRFFSNQAEYAADKLTMILQEIDASKCDCRGECVQVTIVSQPTDVTAAIGETAIFMVTVGGTAPFTYQWYADDVLMPGEISDTLSIVVSAGNQDTLFTVEISNACGTATSVPVEVVNTCASYALLQNTSQLVEIWSGNVIGSSSYPTSMRRMLQNNGLLVVNNDLIWQTEQLSADLTNDWGKNRLWYSSDFGGTWNLVDRPTDDWWEEVDSNYATKQANSAFICLKRSGDKVYANYFYDSTRQFMICSTFGGTSTPWTVHHVSYTQQDQRQYTGNHAKIQSHGYQFGLTTGGKPVIGGKATENGGWQNIDTLDGRADGSEYRNDPNVITVPATNAGIKYLQYRVPPYDNYPDNCYSIENVGNWIFMGAGTDNTWVFNPADPVATDPPKALLRTDWDSIQWTYTDDNLNTEWTYEVVSDYRRNATLINDDRTRWGWVVNRTLTEVLIPYGGFDVDGGVDVGKYRYYRVGSGSLVQGDYNYSTLLTSNVASETTLATVRLFYIEAVRRYVLLWSYNQNTTSDQWPQRFYMRVADTPAVADFSPPLQVEHYTGFFGGAQLGVQSSGGYALDYSVTESKWVVSALHLVGTGSQYQQITGAFDDIFYCETFT